MGQSVFERLAKQFSDLCSTNKGVGAVDLQNVMITAGKVFFHAVSTEKIYFSKIPSLLKKEPIKVRGKKWQRGFFLALVLVESN